jgi:hypothetical protein
MAEILAETPVENPAENPEEFPEEFLEELLEEPGIGTCPAEDGFPDSNSFDDLIRTAEPMPAPPAVSREEEDAQYVRAALSPEEKQKLEEELDDMGYWSIETVRNVVMTNSVKQTFKSVNTWKCGIDPEMMMMIDVRTQFRIFVDDDNIYSREELVEAFPFDAMKTTPEEVFDQQEIGAFPPKKYAITEADGTTNYEYLARSVGETDGFIMIEDMVGAAARKNYKARRAPVHVFKTKIYFAGERWEEFHMLGKFVRSLTTFAPALTNGPMGRVFAAIGQQKGPALLRDRNGVKEDRETAKAAKVRAAEQAESARRAAELRKREEALRKREAEARRKEAETRRKEEETRRKEEELRWRLAEAERLEAKFRDKPPTRAPKKVPPRTATPEDPLAGIDDILDGVMATLDVLAGVDDILDDVMATLDELE